MNKEEIIILVKQYLSQSIQGLEMENPKFDFKSKWYDLKSTNDLAEFLKDSSAIANTFGPDGLIVIGFNDKTKEFVSSPFSSSGLKDPSALSDVISRHVDRPFNIAYYEDIFDGNILGILHVPPSIDKPHVIRNYKTEKKGNTREEPHKIFIRKGSQTFIANRNDLELMIYDRKNISPEFELHTFFHKEAFTLNYHVANRNHVDDLLAIMIALNIENSGRRPVSICHVKLTLSEFIDPSPSEIYVFETTTTLNTYPLIVQPGQLLHKEVEFFSEQRYSYDKRNDICETLKKNLNKLSIKSISVTLSSGQVLNFEVVIIGT